VTRPACVTQVTVYCLRKLVVTVLWWACLRVMRDCRPGGINTEYPKYPTSVHPTVTITAKCDMQNSIGCLRYGNPSPEQGSSLRWRTDSTHVVKLYRYESTSVYIGMHFCRVSKISKIPSDPYEAVLRNLGAYKSIFSHPQQQGHYHGNKTSSLNTQQNGPPNSIPFTYGCDYNKHPLL
jgi:hypothetical protein